MKAELRFLTGEASSAVIQIKIGKMIVFADFYKNIPSKEHLNDLLKKYKRIYEEYLK